ncbi:response regulator [Spirosoma endbachense]|uniref:Response regulatory domain-containing protein n=1 Tax=Spirosoma endbachense TaxID=2666025 RepID=A0A6P1VX04_9BACT|nr:response regulator [Spirosoma endbachense]QHV96317.1 hypothetical protein GJR95_15390 [Spirosoma endbachense]
MIRLVHGLANNNQQSFSDFYDTYAPRLWGIILLAKLPTAQSETILINTLKKAWQQVNQQILPVKPTFVSLLSLAYREGLPREFVKASLPPNPTAMPSSANRYPLDKTVQVLIAGCSLDDQALFTQSLKASMPRVEITFSSGIDQALVHLRTSFLNSTNLPRLLLLTLSESDTQIDWQLLHQIKTSYRLLPIVLIGTEQQAAMAPKAYDLGITSFLVKPPDLDEWKEELALLSKYWLTIASLPNQQRN